MTKRKSGILFHISSLPSPYGIGDFGPDAYKFVEFLAQSGQKIWQILPLNETMCFSGNSPYHSLSACAGNPYLISPDLMVEDGLLARADLDALPKFAVEKVDYAAVYKYKDRLFGIAFENFKKQKDFRRYRKFCAEHAEWLNDYSLFKALKKRFDDKIWNNWPKEIRDRDEASLKEISRELDDEIFKEKFKQYVFYRQWCELKKFANASKIEIFGDLPIYVVYDGVDVWKNPEIFKLDDDKEPLFISGVPPDAFSKTGQLWGHPVYNWEALQKSGFSWWLKRLERNMEIFDIVRIDHFRGLVGYWEVKAGSKTAVEGKWVKAPAEEFFKTLYEKIPNLCIVAEDLGMITRDVTRIIHEFKIAGMRVLLFAFGDDNPWHPYLPENFINNCVAYTGTHDVNTVRGWFETEALEDDKRRVFEYLGKKISADEVAWEFVKLAMYSDADTAIIPLQDILGLGAAARMNIPAKLKDNWEWRLTEGQVTHKVSKKLLALVKDSSR
jgi:4-alpha-glucanotransferase